jgi:hypothetical protein
MHVRGGSGQRASWRVPYAAVDGRAARDLGSAMTDARRCDGGPLGPYRVLHSRPLGGADCQP